MKAKYGGMTVSEARRLKGFEAEHSKLQRLLADAEQDNAALRERMGDIAAQKRRRGQSARAGAIAVRRPICPFRRGPHDL